MRTRRRQNREGEEGEEERRDGYHEPMLVHDTLVLADTLHFIFQACFVRPPSVCF